MFFVRFWGVRGSIACPGEKTLKFGGNTTCLEIRAGNRIIIVDFGTGIYALGAYLVKNDLKESGIDTDIFVSHTHLDHLAGFQMFLPFFIKNSTIRIQGPFQPNKESLFSLFANQMSYRFWPVRLNELPASVSFNEIYETELDLGGGVLCKTKYLNHPVICLGYRFEYQGKSIVTAFDNEPYRNVFAGSNPADYADDFFAADAVRTGERIASEENQKLVEFYRDADILICDSQYTDEEYKNGREYWGHSTIESSIEAARRANVKKLLLFHHDPGHDDVYLSNLEEQCLSKCASEAGIQIMVSREGLLVEP